MHSNKSSHSPRPQINANLAFAVFDQLSNQTPEGAANVVCSPACLESALLLLGLGAQNEIADQLLTALRLPELAKKPLAERQKVLLELQAQMHMAVRKSGSRSRMICSINHPEQSAK